MSPNRIATSVLLLLLAAGPAGADTITDWNERAETIASGKGLTALPNTHTMALLHVAVFEAVNAIDRKFTPYCPGLDAAPNWPKEGAAAAAAHTILVSAFPDQRTALDAMLASDVKAIPESTVRDMAVALGKRAAERLLVDHAQDGMGAREEYRPRTMAGVYVPTTVPVSPTHGTVRPWVMAAGSQFRPAAPPALDSAAWAADLEEVRTLAGRDSKVRTGEQTEIARFWFLNGPATWNPVVRQLAAKRDLGLTESARLFALIAIAADDAYIAVYDAKYYYHFWRPITAIRNADVTGNPAMPRDASWMPFGQGTLPMGDTPMHPEYPCAHCITSAAVGTILKSIVGETVPEITLKSPTAPGVVRKWSQIQDYMDEVAAARIYAGFHYRFSTVVGMDMGRKIAELTLATRMRPL